MTEFQGDLLAKTADTGKGAELAAELQGVRSSMGGEHEVLPTVEETPRTIVPGRLLDNRDMGRYYVLSVAPRDKDGEEMVILRKLGEDSDPTTKQPTITKKLSSLTAQLEEEDSAWSWAS